MYEYVSGKAMWAYISSPNTRFSPAKYGITVLTDPETANKFEGQFGLSQVKDKSGGSKYEEPAFSFNRTTEFKTKKGDIERRSAPKLYDGDGNSLDVTVGNGSKVTVKIKPYSNNFGKFAELIAVRVDELAEYDGGSEDLDNEEF